MKTLWKRMSVGAMAFVTLVLCISGSDVMALGVSPGAFCAQGVPVGVKTDTGVDITITNDTDKERVFSIKVDGMPVLRGASMRGYLTMPELSWFMLDKTEVNAPPEGKAVSRISVDIPDEEKYYNQHWGVSCLIEYGGQKGLFQEAVKTVYMFETKSKADIKGRPYGDLGVAPSIVSIDAADKKTAVGAFTIYNNTAEACTCKLTTSVPEVSIANLKLNASPGYEWLADANMVVLNKTTVKVKAGGTARVDVSQKVTGDLLKDGCKLEGIVFIESDKGEVNFVRVQIEKTAAIKPVEDKSGK